MTFKEIYAIVELLATLIRLVLMLWLLVRVGSVWATNDHAQVQDPTWLLTTLLLLVLAL